MNDRFQGAPTSHKCAQRVQAIHPIAVWPYCDPLKYKLAIQGMFRYYVHHIPEEHLKIKIHLPK
jgi:hypothetical protein